VRVRVIFLTENIGATVPFHHQYIISRLVKEMVAHNEEFSGFKQFTFSGIKGQTKVSRDGLQILSSRITIVFSSTNVKFIEFLMSKIFACRKLEIANLRIRPESVEEEELPAFTNKMKYLCISPIILSNPVLEGYDPKKFVLPTTDPFSDLIYESTMVAMDKTGLYSAEKMASFYKFQIVPDMEYLHKIREEEKKIARIYNTYISEAKYEVRGYTLPFTLYAEPEVQEFIFSVGVGTITNEGFGMLDIPVSEGKRGSTPYLVKRLQPPTPPAV